MLQEHFMLRIALLPNLLVCICCDAQMLPDDKISFIGAEACTATPRIYGRLHIGSVYPPPGQGGVIV